MDLSIAQLSMYCFFVPVLNVVDKPIFISLVKGKFLATLI